MDQICNSKINGGRREREDVTSGGRSSGAKNEEEAEGEKEREEKGEEARHHFRSPRLAVPA